MTKRKFRAGAISRFVYVLVGFLLPFVAAAAGFGVAKPGAVRLIYALTINCWSKASKQQLDPAPSQNLFRYAELKDGTIRDITRYIKFRNEKKR